MVHAIDAVARALDHLNRALMVLFKGATIVLLGVIVAVVGAGVWWRYVLNDSLSWTEELAKYLMVWMTFTGAPVALRIGGHVGIELFPDAMPGRLRQFVYALIHMITVAVMLALVYYGYNLAQNASIQTTSTFKMSLYYVYLALPVGAAAMLVIALQSYFEALGGVLGSPRGYAATNVDADVVDYE